MWRILARNGLNRLSWIDRRTGRVIRRYERSSPGELVHLDVKKVGQIPQTGLADPLWGILLIGVTRSELGKCCTRYRPCERGTTTPTNGESLEWASIRLGIPTDSEVRICPRLRDEASQGSGH